MEGGGYISWFTIVYIFNFVYIGGGGALEMFGHIHRAFRSLGTDEKARFASTLAARNGSQCIGSCWP